MCRQRMLEVLGDESPTYDRIRFVCTTPREDGRPWLQLPRTYQLEDPGTYFNTDIKVRHENLLTRSNWAMAFKSSAIQPPGRKSGEDPEQEARTGGTSPGGGTKLLGMPLTKAEAGRALDHRPKSPSGRYICWDDQAWCGCKRKNCPHSHKPIGKANLLDRTVRMQLIRRGGIKTGPRIKEDREACTRIEELRKQQAKEDAD